MKTLILALIALALTSTAFASTLSCHYTQEAAGVTKTLDVSIDTETYKTDIAKLTPYGIRNLVFENVVILCNQLNSVVSFVHDKSTEAEITIRPHGTGFIDFKKSIHGAFTLDLTCETYDIAAICG